MTAPKHRSAAIAPDQAYPRATAKPPGPQHRPLPSMRCLSFPLSPAQPRRGDGPEIQGPSGPPWRGLPRSAQGAGTSRLNAAARDPSRPAHLAVGPRPSSLPLRPRQRSDAIPPARARSSSPSHGRTRSGACPRSNGAPPSAAGSDSPARGFSRCHGAELPVGGRHHAAPQSIHPPRRQPARNFPRHSEAGIPPRKPRQHCLNHPLESKTSYSACNHTSGTAPIGGERGATTAIRGGQLEDQLAGDAAITGGITAQQTAQ
jgi:hypothetical protein